ncbi:MAG: pitrilysin family protein [Rubricoccaceae bacterium]|nr:pitrilysin family protein [Rubricoccaceae bacterium]
MADFQTESPETETNTIADRVVEEQVGGIHLCVLPTDVRDVVTFRGSFEPGPDLSSRDDLLQSLAANLLDKGTLSRDRFEIAEALEGRGAQLSFYSDALRVGFVGRTLRDDLGDVLGLLAEQLQEPLFDLDEFDKARTRAIAGVRQSMDSTSARAGGALKRALYAPSHPNYVPDPKQQIEQLQSLTLEDVKGFHRKHFASDAFRLIIVGDVEPRQAEALVRSSLSNWRTSGLPAVFDPDPIPASSDSGRIVTEMPDKLNLDVQIGHGLDLRRDSNDFLPLYAGAYILGGNFSARLMQIVRDRMGLTYGIRSSISGVTVEHAGHWKTSVSLSQQNLEQGIEATMKVIRQFVEEGITADELDAVKTTLSGTHVVGMATTGGLAARLLVNSERGFPVSYLDDYPSLVDSITVDDVNTTVRCYFDPDDLKVSVAGTLPG